VRVCVESDGVVEVGGKESRGPRSTETHVQTVNQTIAKTAVRTLFLVLLAGAAVLLVLFAARTAERPLWRVELGRLAAVVAVAAAVWVARRTSERRRPPLDDVRQPARGSVVPSRPRRAHVLKRFLGQTLARPLGLLGVEYVFHEHRRLLGVEQAAGHRARQELVSRHLQVAH